MRQWGEESAKNRQGELQDDYFHLRKEEGGREDGAGTKKVSVSQ